MKSKTTFNKLNTLQAFIVCLISFFYTRPTFAQQIPELIGEIIPFTQTFPGPNDSATIRGDMKVIGNSILGIQGITEDDRTRVYTPNEDYNGTSRNNGITRGYIDIDSDPSFNPVFSSPLSASETEFSGPINIYGSPITSTPSDTGTFSSSTAELNISNPLNDTGISCSRIVKAFLYWGAMYEAESLDLGEPIIQRPDCINPDGTPCEYFTDIKILPPGATEYIDIKYNNSGIDYNSLKSEVIIDGVPGRIYSHSETEIVRDAIYVCKADVTSLFTHLQDQDETVEGNWTVANIRAVTGTKNSGAGAGWSLAVIYEDLFASQKNIYLYDGYVAIVRGNGALSGSVEFNISGFETIPTGPVNVDLASISLEGDIGIFGDRFEINDENDDQTKSENWAPIAVYPGQDANNFYDSSIYSKGAINRFPNSSNTLGYDSDHFTLANPNNEYISNSDNEADFRIYTEGDAIGNFFNAFAIEVIAPDLEAIKRVYKNDGSNNNLADEEVFLGDTINYEITVTNTGNENVANTNFTGLIPINTTLDLNTLTLNGTPIPNEEVFITDTTTIDSLTGLSFNTKQINFTIPDSLLEVGESAVISFQVSVISDCLLLQNTCVNSIQSSEEIAYFGEFNDNNGIPFRTISSYESIACTSGTTGPTLILNLENSCLILPEIVDVVICDDSAKLQGGIGFEAYEWFLNGERLTTNIDGTPIDSNNNTLLVNESGVYTLNQIKSTTLSFLSCQDVESTFNVELLNTLDNPLTSFGEALTPVCSDNGIEVIEILLCEEPVELSTNFADGTIYSWQKFDTSSGCTQNGENCPFTNASSSSYYVEISNEASFSLSELGSYKLSISVPGGCTFDYFFEASENCNTLNIASFNESIESNIDIFPNPAQDILTIKSSNINKLDQILIHDLQGKIVFSQEFNENINIESLNSGMYFITIQTEENKVTKTILKK